MLFELLFDRGFSLGPQGPAADIFVTITVEGAKASLCA